MFWSPAGSVEASSSEVVGSVALVSALEATSVIEEARVTSESVVPGMLSNSEGEIIHGIGICTRHDRNYIPISA